jgi:hypothetical protein
MQRAGPYKLTYEGLQRHAFTFHASVDVKSIIQAVRL